MNGITSKTKDLKLHIEVHFGESGLSEVMDWANEQQRLRDEDNQEIILLRTYSKVAWKLYWKLKEEVEGLEGNVKEKKVEAEGLERSLEEDKKELEELDKSLREVEKDTDEFDEWVNGLSLDMITDRMRQKLELLHGMMDERMNQFNETKEVDKLNEMFDELLEKLDKLDREELDNLLEIKNILKGLIKRVNKCNEMGIFLGSVKVEGLDQMMEQVEELIKRAKKKLHMHSEDQKESCIDLQLLKSIWWLPMLCLLAWLLQLWTLLSSNLSDER